MSIDRLTLVGNEPHEQVTKAIIGSAHTINEMDIGFLPVMKHSPYSFNFQKTYGSNGSKVLLQIGNKGAKLPLIRIDMNPAELGPDGVRDFLLDLQSLLPDGSEWLKAHARVTRVDVAIDLNGVALGDIEVFTTYPVSHETFSRTGKKQSIYLGTVKSLHRVRIYDKAAQLASKGKFTPSDQMTRIETIVKSGGFFRDLPLLANPLTRVRVVQVPATPPKVNRRDWYFFLHAVKGDGPLVALSMLPPKTRSRYRKALEAGGVEWWGDQALWSLWPSIVANSELLWQLHAPVTSGPPPPDWSAGLPI